MPPPPPRHTPSCLPRKNVSTRLNAIAKTTVVMCARRTNGRTHRCQNVAHYTPHLGHAEEQGHVARDAFLLQDLARADALPGAGDLDQDARLIDACRPNEPADATTRATPRREQQEKTVIISQHERVIWPHAPGQRRMIATYYIITLPSSLAIAG